MKTIVARSLLLLAVCVGDISPAGAQRSLESIRQAWGNCAVKMTMSPEFLALSPKIGARVPPDMSSDNDRVTPEEARQLQTLLQDYVVPCRPLELEAARSFQPPIVAVLDAAFANTDANYGRLIAGEITWGEFRHESHALEAWVDAEVHRLNTAPTGPSGDDPTDPAKR
jgi:hypothetical protein